MSKLDEMPLEDGLEKNPAEQAEEKPFDPEEYLNSKITSERSGYEERVNDIAEERGIKAEDLIEADAYREERAREKTGSELSRAAVERIINSDLVLDYVDDDKILLKGNIDGKNYEIKASPDGFGYQVIDSKIDGEPLDHEAAKEILNDYTNIAAGRDRMIEKMRHDAGDKNNE